MATPACDRPITTERLTLVPRTAAEVRAEIAGMDAGQRTQLSAAWLAQLDDPQVGTWTLGFAIRDRSTGAAVGSCGFKGPPDEDGMVEIAYGIEPGHQRRGYATEAARALVEYAWRAGHVTIVRAHTLPDGHASIRVLTRCGFTRVAEVVDPDDGLVVRWECRRECR